MTEQPNEKRNKRQFHYRLGSWAFFWLRGPVVQFGPWAEKGYSNRGFSIIRWWSFGSLLIEKHL